MKNTLAIIKPDAMKKGHEELMRLYQENPEFMN